MNKMTYNEMLKYSAELVVKNNQDEAVKLLILLQQENESLKDKINKAIEYIINGSDFKSIYFKKTDEELWKILLEDNIKNNLLDILRGEDN